LSNLLSGDLVTTPINYINNNGMLITMAETWAIHNMGSV